MSALNYLRQDGPGNEATFLIGTDSEAFASRLERAASGPTDTPTPSGEKGDDYDAGGPVTRFTDEFGPLNLGVLEYVGLSGHEIADAIQTRVNELYRNEFPVLKPRFERKCTACAAELNERVEECPECGGDVREPDAAEKRRAEQLLKSVNREGQSLRSLAKACEWDQWLLGVPIIVVRYEYHLRDGEIVARQPEELVKGDPKQLVPVVDEHRRIGGYWWACPACRHAEDYQPEHESGACPRCDATLREVFFAEFTDRGSGDDADEFYFREEIITFPWAFPRLHGLDGLSAIHHVWLKQLIIEFQDSYAGAFYDPESERLPNQFIVLHTTNAEQWEERLKKAREKAEDDRYDSPIFANEYGQQDASTPEVQVVDAMPDELLGQNEQLKETLKKDIRQAINIADVFDSDLEEAGGLNNEGLQIEVTDRSIAAQQHDYGEGWLDSLAKRLGIDDWTIAYIPSTGPDAADLADEVQAGLLAERAGLDARLEDGQTEVADGPMDPEPAAGGMGGPEGFDGPSAGSGGIQSATGTDNASHDYGPAEETKAVGDLDVAADALFEAHRHMVGPDIAEQRAREPFWSADEDMPEFVEQLIREALRSGAISRVSEKLPAGTTRSEVRGFFESELSKPQGWSLRSLTENYADRFGVSEDDAVTAVRTQTTNILNEARAEGYRAQGDTDERQFKWVGPVDDDNTDACEWLRQRSNPDFQGDPKTLDELQDLVSEAQREFFPDFRGADWTPHYNCRHTYVEHFE